MKQNKRIWIIGNILAVTMLALAIGDKAISYGVKTNALSNTTAITVPVSVAEKGEEAWSLTLVNAQHPLTSNQSVSLQELPGGEKLDKRICPALREMFAAAEKDGIYPVVTSGYRTRADQQDIYDSRIAKYEYMGCTEKEAQNEVKCWVAKPGTSEHELGLAADIGAADNRSTAKKVYKWLQKNAYRFGFILRYPPDKTDLTGIASEPWHYRYVGQKAAADMVRQNLCLEEYVQKQ